MLCLHSHLSLAKSKHVRLKASVWENAVYLSIQKRPEASGNNWSLHEVGDGYGGAITAEKTEQRKDTNDGKARYSPRLNIVGGIYVHHVVRRHTNHRERRFAAASRCVVSDSRTSFLGYNFKRYRYSCCDAVDRLDGGTLGSA